jgi:D-beta-D-heptose 7-phosphate kinase/D-beta-D-heptose 1-phosphate adenosyltransferase
VEQRAAVLAALACVDAVVVFDEDTPLNLINALQPKVLAKGADYSEDQVVGGKEVKSWGGNVALVDLVAGVSTTKIAERSGTPPREARGKDSDRAHNHRISSVTLPPTR